MTMFLRYITKDRRLGQALVLWACFAAAVAVKTTGWTREHTVYPVFAAGAQHWWADKSLYDEYQLTEGIDGYRYSPAFAVALTPLAFLPNSVGSTIWNVGSIALLLWALHLLVRDVLPGSWPARREGNFLMLTLAGSIIGVWSGQSNALVLALVMMSLAAIARQRWWAASFLLAMPVFVKLWPLAIVMLLLAFWPRKLIARFLVACAVLLLIPFLTRPPNIVMWQYNTWAYSLMNPLQGRWPGYRDAWTIWEQFSLPNRHVYMLMQLTTAFGVFCWCWWQYRRETISQKTLSLESPSQCSDGDSLGGKQSSGHLLMLIFSMWASWQLFFGPGTEQLTYGLIAPSASWAVMVSFAEKRACWLTLTAWAMLAFLPAGDVEQIITRAFPVGKLFLPLSVLLFVAWLVWHEREANSVRSPLPLGEG